jgi:hypothetical protein
LIHGLLIFGVLVVAANVLIVLVMAGYSLAERRVGHDPLDRCFGQDEPAAVFELYPERERQVRHAPQKRPSAASTASAVTAAARRPRCPQE